MENYTQIKELNQVIGKTITRVEENLLSDNADTVLFFDKEFVVFYARAKYDGEPFFVEVVKDDLSVYEQYRIGIISKEEYEIIQKEAREGRLKDLQASELSLRAHLIKKYGVPQNT